MTLLKTGGAGVITLDNNCVDKLLASGSGDAALLYIYILRSGGEIDPSCAENDLKMTPERINKAAAVLTSLGLAAGGEQPSPEDLTAGDIAGSLNCDAAFHSVADEAERLLNRKLTEMDLRRLLGIYRSCSFEPETIVLLISSCCREYAEKNGAGKTPSMSIVEKEAKLWQDKNVVSADDAEEYLRRRSEQRTQIGLIAKALGISGRHMAPTERAFIEKWMDMGFECDAVEKAYDITVTRTGKLAWKYMDAILANWHQKGITAPEADTDSRPAPAGEETHEQRALRQLMEWKKLRSQGQ